MSLGTLPKAAFPVPNQNLKVVKDFVEALRVSQHKAIYMIALGTTMHKAEEC
jgi:hypothetical protein